MNRWRNRSDDDVRRPALEESDMVYRAKHAHPASTSSGYRDLPDALWMNVETRWSGAAAPLAGSHSILAKARSRASSGTFVSDNARNENRALRDKLHIQFS